MPEKTCFRVPFRRKYELTKLALRATEVDDDIESLDDPRLLLCPDGTTLNVIRREKQGRRERFASI
jgi:hypothetical protein